MFILPFGQNHYKFGKYEQFKNDMQYTQQWTRNWNGGNIPFARNQWDMVWFNFLRLFWLNKPVILFFCLH